VIATFAQAIRSTIPPPHRSKKRGANIAQQFARALVRLSRSSPHLTPERLLRPRSTEAISLCGLLQTYIQHYRFECAITSSVRTLWGFAFSSWVCRACKACHNSRRSVRKRKSAERTRGPRKKTWYKLFSRPPGGSFQDAASPPKRRCCHKAMTQPATRFGQARLPGKNVRAPARPLRPEDRARLARPRSSTGPERAPGAHRNVASETPRFGRSPALFHSTQSR